MKKKQTFRVCAGTLLHDPVNRDINYMLTPHRLAEQGDDLALRHLAHNPRAVDYFEQPLPENLDEMIADYLAREKGKTATTADIAETDGIAPESGSATDAKSETEQPIEQPLPENLDEIPTTEPAAEVTVESTPELDPEGIIEQPVLPQKKRARKSRTGKPLDVQSMDKDADANPEIMVESKE